MYFVLIILHRKYKYDLNGVRDSSVHDQLRTTVNCNLQSVQEFSKTGTIFGFGIAQLRRVSPRNHVPCVERVVWITKVQFCLKYMVQ